MKASWLKFAALLFAPALSNSAAAGRDAGLKSLFENRRWFELRASVEGTDAPAFYRVAVACAFDDVEQAEKHFRQMLRAGSQPAENFDAHGLLASAHMRAGRYREALSHLKAMHAIQPGYGGLGGAVALFRSLSEYPEPAVARRGYSEVRLSRDMFIPVVVNGKPASYGFDTGMDLSVISEGEAGRLNLAVHDVAGSRFQDGASGRRVAVRFAVADRLAVGRFELKNTVFLVVRDDAMPFAELPEGKQGILGFPVLRAFRTVRWDRDGLLQLGFPSGSKSNPNLCVPGNSSPVVEGRFGPRAINVLIDTGSGRTMLTSRFARDFPDVVGGTGTKELTRLRGLGGSQEVVAIRLPELRFRAGEFDLVLRPAQVLPPDPSVDRSSYHVWLGMDLLGQARRVTLDFEAMRFELE